MRVIVASENPVKIDAVKETFSKFYNDVEVQGIKVDSGVPAQPINEDTFTGAKNRAHKLFDENFDADYFVGIEGGVSKYYNNWFAFGCMYILDKEGKSAFGTSPHFELPGKVINELLKGKELGSLIDDLTNEKNTKQNSGAIGYLTDGILDRKNLYISGLITALVPFLNKKMYFDER